MQVKQQTVHQDIIRATIPEKEYEQLLAQAVAEKSGVDLSLPNVSYRVNFDRRDTSVGFERWAEVEIKVDQLFPKEQE